MPLAKPWVLKSLLLLGLGACAQTHAQTKTNDDDALALEGAPPPESSTESPLRLSLELGAGRVEQRGVAGSVEGRRASVDLRYATTLDNGIRLAFSDRLDDIHPLLPGQRATRNSVREAYLGWQPQGGAATVEIGRINLRNGPAFGYNPTDYFRTGALQTVTTADPVALRENRLGTVMLKLGQTWSQGVISLALAPKLESTPDNDDWSLNLGATNARHRALLSTTARFSDRWSGQGLLLLQPGSHHKIGASVTGLVSDAAVLHGEWSAGKSQTLLDRVLGVPGPRSTYYQAAVGLTYTLPGGLAVTAEAEYNGAGLDRSGWSTLMSSGPTGYPRYGQLTQTDQELGARRAWLLYVAKKGIGLKQLDLTAFVRQNGVDHSTLVWAELRYHWPRFDTALQWQRASGTTFSEYGAMAYRQVVQLLGAMYF